MVYKNWSPKPTNCDQLLSTQSVGLGSSDLHSTFNIINKSAQLWKFLIWNFFPLYTISILRVLFPQWFWNLVLRAYIVVYLLTKNNYKKRRFFNNTLKWQMRLQELSVLKYMLSERESNEGRLFFLWKKNPFKIYKKFVKLFCILCHGHCFEKFAQFRVWDIAVNYRDFRITSVNNTSFCPNFA